MPINKLKTTSIETDAITADLLAAGSVTVADIPDAEITDAKLHTNLDFSAKTFTMHTNHVTHAMVTQHQAQLAIGADQIDSGSPTFGGDVTITGNLTVNGTTTTLNTETLTVDDNIIVLNNNEAGTPSQNAGIEIERGTSTNVSLRWNETTDKWQFTNDGTTYADIGDGGDVVDDTTPQLGGDLDTNGKNISFGDSATPGTDDTLSFGADNDLQIYHNTSDGHNYMQLNDKRLYVKAVDSGLTGPYIIFDHDTSSPSTVDFSTVLVATSRDSASASQTIGQITYGTPNVTSGSFRGSIRFDVTDSNGISEYVRLDGNSDRIDLKKAVRFSEAFTFPTSDGSANQVLQTDGAGVVTWASAGGEITVQDEGSALSTAATTLNFVGAGVTATGTGATKTISISGTGGGATSAYAKFTYEISATVNSVSGNDTNGNTLSYSAGNNVVEVFVNGVKQQEGSGKDYQATTGNSVVFTNNLYSGDLVDVVAYNMFSAGNINIDGSGNLEIGNDIIFEGATANAYETTLTVTDPTADRTITLPDLSGTILVNENLDKIITFPDLSGTILVNENLGGDPANDNGNLIISHGATGLPMASIEAGAINNVIIGNQNCTDLTTGDHNYVIGKNTLDVGTTDNTNVLIGSGILSAGSGHQRNTIIGALYTATHSSSSGQYSNTAIGVGAGQRISVGDYNTHIGSYADSYYNNSSYGVSVGYQARHGHYDGVSIGFRAGTSMNGQSDYCTLIGTYAGYDMDAGDRCTFVGRACGYSGGSGSYNTGVGMDAVRDLTNGGYNTGIGYASGRNIESGSYNTFLGMNAGYDLTTGSNNTIIGYNAANSNTNDLISGSNNIIIGFQAQSTSTSMSNTIVLGDANITSFTCNVQSISALSDERDKTDIQDLTLGLDFIKAMRPVQFTWNRRDGTLGTRKEVGFIAQELQEVEMDFNTKNRTHMVNNDDPSKLLAAPMQSYPILIKAIQELSAKVDSLQAEVNTLKNGG